MRIFFIFILNFTVTCSLFAQDKQIQDKQITVVVKSGGKALSGVGVYIATESFTAPGETGSDGEFSTTILYSGDIIPGEKYIITCEKEGYEKMTKSGNIGDDKIDYIFNFDLKPIKTKHIIISVLDQFDESTLEGVTVVVETKKKLVLKTGNFGDLSLELLPNELHNEKQLYIRLKKENYNEKQVWINLSESAHSIYLKKKNDTPTEDPMPPRVINYIPVAGNFYRDENLSGWIYSIGLVSGIGAISYSTIRIPSLEKKALLAVSNTGRENYLAQAESHRNLRKGAYIFSGVLIGSSLIHCIIKSNKINRQSHSSMSENFELGFGSEGIGLVFRF